MNAPSNQSPLTQEIFDKLNKQADPKRANQAKRFFKTGIGQYAEDDKFLGISVPQIRLMESAYPQLSPQDTLPLLHSEWHEIRLFSLIHLANLYRRSRHDLDRQEEIYTLYSQNTKYINNWDLVDCSSHLIVGPHLQHEENHLTLKQFARSTSLWERRIAMVACWFYSRNIELHQITFDIAEILIYDRQDLIQKAVGWMLREMGKKNRVLLCQFLDQYAATMPRTALRYSLEKFNQNSKKYYMNLGK